MSSPRELEEESLDDFARLLKRHLDENIERYYPESPISDSPQLIRIQRLRNSTFFHFELSVEGRSRVVFVKAPAGSHHRGAFADGGSRQIPSELRFFPKPSIEAKGEKEYLALSSIERSFESNGDRRFVTIRTLDFLPESGAIVMEKLEACSPLSDAIGSTSRLKRRAHLRSLLDAFELSGAWLRRFHQSPALDHSLERFRSRSEWLGLVSRLIEYLTQAEAGSAVRDELIDFMERTASDVLPEELPLSLCHGDFAPRNVLVTAENRVAVIDTSASWSAPAFHDLASFLHAIKTSPQQLSSVGLAHDRPTLRSYEGAFMKGYFSGEAVPVKAIRLFEVQELLAYWVSIIHQSRMARGLKGPVKGARRALWSPVFNFQLGALLKELKSNA